MHMRTRFVTVAAALLLASASYAQENAAQQPPPVQQPAAPAAEQQPTFGSIDLGFRGTDSTGDLARYERYRDLQSGAFSQIAFGKATDTYLFDAAANNIGYNDQQYTARFIGSRLRFRGGFVGVPLNYGYNTETPWIQESTNVFTLSTSARQLVQNKAAGVVGVPQAASQLNTASIYAGIANPFGMSSLRQTGSFALSYDASGNVSVDMAVQSTKRSGQQPWGASFAFNNANELPMALDNRTNDVNAGMEWANDKGMMRVAYIGSFFNNNIHELVWDNPLRLTDTTPYDPSGYTNGNGPAQGRMSMAPDNTMNTVSAIGMVKLPNRTTVNGTVSYSANSQNDTLIPWTINPVIANAAVYQSFPGLASLPRDTAEAKVHAVNAMFNFTSRPSRYVGFTAKYRYNDRNNLTPEFDAIEYVRFDAVPEETGGISEYMNVKQNRVDLDATFSGIPYTSARVGYSYDTYNRTHRAFTDLNDNIWRASLDTVGNQYVTVRGLYEHTKRRGSGFNEEWIVEGGAQADLRFYDDAEYDRDKGTLMFVVSPVQIVDVTFSVAAGKDDYVDSGFGLLDNKNTNYTVGFNVNPTEKVGFGASYGRDEYTADQKSRNANPAPDPSWTDPSRDWTLNNKEKVNNFELYLDLPKVIEKTNVRFNYDYSDSDNGFTFGGPRIPALAAIGQFLPLPNVTNKWQRASVDVQYFIHPKVGVGVGYWYEKFEVSDFATINQPGTDTPNIAYLGEISTGYGNRPYKGNTAFVRLLYLF
jgi:MtrB/PioB family decaheme-associated outer membrane protein